MERKYKIGDLIMWRHTPPIMSTVYEIIAYTKDGYELAWTNESGNKRTGVEVTQNAEKHYKKLTKLERALK